jgi:hypothetical protein
MEPLRPTSVLRCGAPEGSVKQVLSLEERLARYADRSRAQVEGLPPSEAREALLKKIRRTENAVRLCEWLAPPPETSVKSSARTLG